MEYSSYLLLDKVIVANFQVSYLQFLFFKCLNISPIWIVYLMNLGKLNCFKAQSRVIKFLYFILNDIFIIRFINILIYYFEVLTTFLNPYIPLTLFFKTLSLQKYNIKFLLNYYFYKKVLILWVNLTRNPFYKS